MTSCSTIWLEPNCRTISIWVSSDMATPGYGAICCTCSASQTRRQITKSAIIQNPNFVPRLTAKASPQHLYNCTHPLVRVITSFLNVRLKKRARNCWTWEIHWPSGSVLPIVQKTTFLNEGYTSVCAQDAVVTKLSRARSGTSRANHIGLQSIVVGFAWHVLHWIWISNLGFIPTLH